MRVMEKVNDRARTDAHQQVAGDTEILMINTVEEFLDLSRRKTGRFRAWSDTARPGTCELVAETGELRRARCEEFFGQTAVERISLAHLPLRVERVEEDAPKRGQQGRGPYYASEDESTLRIIPRPHS